MPLYPKQDPFWMKIINKKGEVNFNQWMKMGKGRYGLSPWGCRSARNQYVHCSNIFRYMNKCPCMTQLCWWRWSGSCAFLKIFGSQRSCAFLVMFPNPLPCIDANKRMFLGGLFHHLDMAEMINTKNGKVKIHAMLLYQMDRWSTKIKGCVKHIEPQHKNV